MEYLWVPGIIAACRRRDVVVNETLHMPRNRAWEVIITSFGPRRGRASAAHRYHDTDTIHITKFSFRYDTGFDTYHNTPDLLPHTFLIILSYIPKLKS